MPNLCVYCRSIADRRKILENNVQEIPGRIMLSEKKFVQKESELAGIVSRVIKEGLEGLVLKDVQVIIAIKSVQK